jgi:hypothetical protein
VHHRNRGLLVVPVLAAALIPLVSFANERGPGVNESAVLAACRRTAGCSYVPYGKSGTTNGCSPVICFYCVGWKCWPLRPKGNPSGPDEVNTLLGSTPTNAPPKSAP